MNFGTSILIKTDTRTLMTDKQSKNNETFFGYKNHTKVDKKGKIIDKYWVTDASVHYSKVLDDLLDEQDAEQDFYGDSAYSGEEQEKLLQNMKWITKHMKKDTATNHWQRNKKQITEKNQKQGQE